MLPDGRGEQDADKRAVCGRDRVGVNFEHLGEDLKDIGDEFWSMLGSGTRQCKELTIHILLYDDRKRSEQLAFKLFDELGIARAHKPNAVLE